MSILMDALKQQQQHTLPQPNDSLAFWRKLALALALLLALCLGALLAYWFSPSPVQYNRQAVADETATPASSEQISAVLTLNPDTASPTQLPQQLEQSLNPPPTPVQEAFVSPPPVATMTAGTAAAEPQPLQASSKATAEPIANSTEVSAELRDKFASALEATAQNVRPATVRSHNAPAVDIASLERPLQLQIPPLKFEAHVYATSTNQRWVKVNGKTLQEGQWVTADIRIKEITPQFVLLQLGNQLFSMAALSEWQGV